MGDRGIAVLKFPEGYSADLAVYSHWSGSDLRTAVVHIANSENFKSRVGDVTYAARIVIDQLTKGARDEDAGFGVYPFPRGTNPALLADGDVKVTLDLTTGEVS